MKYAVMSLAQKISETTSFFSAIDLQSKLAKARKRAIDPTTSAFGAIQQEYNVQKPDMRCHEVITITIDNKSTVIREALSQFDTVALA